MVVKLCKKRVYNHSTNLKSTSSQLKCLDYLPRAHLIVLVKNKTQGTIISVKPNRRH